MKRPAYEALRELRNALVSHTTLPGLIRHCVSRTELPDLLDAAGDAEIALPRIRALLDELAGHLEPLDATESKLALSVALAKAGTTGREFGDMTRGPSAARKAKAREAARRRRTSE